MVTLALVGGGLLLGIVSLDKPAREEVSSVVSEGCLIGILIPVSLFAFFKKVSFWDSKILIEVGSTEIRKLSRQVSPRLIIGRLWMIISCRGISFSVSQMIMFVPAAEAARLFGKAQIALIENPL